jgi:hypothetical protein
MKDMPTENTLEDKTQRMQQFWKREVVSRPLIGFQLHSQMRKSWLQIASGDAGEHRVLIPAMIQPEELGEGAETFYQMSLPLAHDIVWTAEPPREIPWLEGMFGCPVTISDARLHPQPYLQHADELAHLVLSDTHPWHQKYVACLEGLVKVSRGRYPVGQPLFPGPADILAALMPQHTLQQAFDESPSLMQRFIARVTEFLINVGQEQATRLPRFYQGYMSGSFYLWCPQPCMGVQHAHFNLLSPDRYQEFFGASNRTISKAFAYMIGSIHLPTVKYIDQFLALDELKAIALYRDSQGVSVQEMLPVMKLVQTRKPLILHGVMDKEDLDTALQELSARGLYLLLSVETTAEAEFWWSYLLQQSQGG